MQLTEGIAERVRLLCDENGITVNRLLTSCGINTSLITDLNKGRVPSAEKILKIAEHFGVTTDYLIGNYVAPIQVPEALSEVQVAFHRGEFEDLTQDEVDKLAEYAKFIKAQRDEK